MSIVTVDSASYPPTSPLLREALVIKGAYPFGPSPNAPDNRLFMDEIDQLSTADRNRALDQYQADGYTSITLGPAVAIGYHGQYPNTNWLSNPEPFLETLRECRRRGLRVTLVPLPDCAPYFDGDRWDWERVERDLTPFYANDEIQALVNEIQCEWEVNCENAEACAAGSWVARTFPNVSRIWWHTPPGHSAPGLSSEPITEAEMWQRFEGAILAVDNCMIVGWAMQDDSIYSPAPEDAQWENFCVNVRDMIRHCNGYNRWPLLDHWAREYRAYAIYNWNAPVSGGPKDWGLSALSLGAINIGDGGPIK